MFRIGSLPGHLYVSAERQKAHAVIRISAAEAEETLAETDGKDLDTDAAQLGHNEMAQLVYQDHYAKDNEHGNRAGEEK